MTITDRRSGSASASTATSRVGGIPEGLGAKRPALIATTANITLSGLQTIDGVTLVAEDRVLVKDQTTAADNGIYAASSGNWTRTPDFSTNGEVVCGTFVFVISGTVNGARTYRVSTSDPITVGTTSLSFARHFGDLDAIAALSGTGLLARTGVNAYALRTLASASAGITWTNGDGASGNPTPVLANDLAALEGLGSVGIAVRSASDTWVQRSIAGTSNEIDVANGSGVSGNPTISLPTTITLTGKTLSGGTFSNPTFATSDNLFTLADNIDSSKTLQFQLSGISASTLRTLTVPDANTTIVGTDATQTLTSKTLTAPDINGGTADSLTSLSVRSTGAAFDLLLANTEVLTANRTLTIDLANANRTVALSGNFTLSGALTFPATAQGDLFYGSATGAVSALAKNTTATRYLSNTAGSNNPAWAQVNLADGVTGDLPLANLTQAGAYAILLNNSGSTADAAFVKISALTETAGFGAGDWVLMEESSGELRKVNYSSLPGAGSIGGSTGATDNAILRADGTGGGTMQSSGITITDAGELLMPTMPLVLAYNSATDTNVSGDGTVVTVDFDTEVTDRGADFATDTFTAPVTGAYDCGGSILLAEMTAGTHVVQVDLVTSNRTYLLANETTPVAAKSYLCTAIGVDMDAADTAFLQLTVSGGAKSVDVFGHATSLLSYIGFALRG